MALTQTEKQRRYRARLKEKKLALSEATRGLPSEPFFKFYNEDGDKCEVDLALDVMGLPPFNFVDDSDGVTHERDPDTFDFSLYPGSIGWAELRVSFLLEAARALAHIINKYKKESVARALTDLEQADLTDPAARKKAMAEIVRLNKIRERLDATIRFPLQAYEIKDM